MIFVLTIINNVNNIVRTKIIRHYSLLVNHYSLLGIQTSILFTIKWSIIKTSISYTGGSKRCNLCLEEKLSILKEKDNCLLKKRSEIISACWHKNRFLVKNLNKERNACDFNNHTPMFQLTCFRDNLIGAPRESRQKGASRDKKARLDKKDAAR